MNAYSSFKQDLDQAIELAKLSPSSHNCQPWQVKLLTSADRDSCIKLDQGSDQNSEQDQNLNIDNNSYCIAIEFASDRLLTSLPSLSKEMYISCGIFSRTLLAIINKQGYSCREHWVDKKGTLVVIEISPDKVNDLPNIEPLKTLLTKRLTNRGPYSPQKMTEDTVKGWQQTAGQFDCRLEIINYPKDIKAIANLVARHGKLDFANREVWTETYRYIRFNKAKVTEDGFYIENLFGNVSLLFKWAFRILFHPTNHWLSQCLGLPRRMAKGLADLVEDAPQLMVVTIDQDSNKGYWQTGYALYELYLSAAKSGLSLHPLSVLLQNNLPRYELQKTLQTDASIVFIARLGEAVNPAHSAPRRTVDSILKTNI